MHQLKTFITTIIVSTIGLIMFVVGLGVTFFLLIAMAIMSLFVKSASKAQYQEQYKKKWQRHFGGSGDEWKTKKTNKPDVIEGQYEIIDNS